MASEYGLSPIYKEEFHQVFEEHQEHPEFKPLLERMKVVDSDGASAMDEDQWEAASALLLSLFFVFSYWVPQMLTQTFSFFPRFQIFILLLLSRSANDRQHFQPSCFRSFCMILFKHHP
jgi:hypothetical protein